jgi:hypothetical protein
MTSVMACSKILASKRASTLLSKEICSVYTLTTPHPSVTPQRRALTLGSLKERTTEADGCKKRGVVSCCWNRGSRCVKTRSLATPLRA